MSGFVCPACDGRGEQRCDTCDGKGYFQVSEDFVDFLKQTVTLDPKMKRCPGCKGKGTWTCSTCRGTGRER